MRGSASRKLCCMFTAPNHSPTPQCCCTNYTYNVHTCLLNSCFRFGSDSIHAECRKSYRSRQQPTDGTHSINTPRCARSVLPWRAHKHVLGIVATIIACSARVLRWVPPLCCVVTPWSPATVRSGLIGPPNAPTRPPHAQTLTEWSLAIQTSQIQQSRG